MVSRFVTPKYQPDQPTVMGLVSRKSLALLGMTNLTNLTNLPTRTRRRARTRVCARARVIRSVTYVRLVKALSSKGCRLTNPFLEVGQVGQRG